jgi:hypothetical protein
MKLQRVAERKQEFAAADVVLASGDERLALPVGHLRTDGDTQMRERLDEATVQEYTDAMLAYGDWGEFPAVTAYYDGEFYWLCDGFHRVAAYKRAFGRFGDNAGHIPARAQAGTKRDAILYATGANDRHGLRRSNADKRKAVSTLLRDGEWSQWSDREIARKCKVSDRLVNTVRAELEATANIRSQTERKGADGRIINVAPIKAAAKVRYVPAEDAELPVDDVPVRQVGPSVVQSSAPASRATLPALGKCSVCGRPLSDPEHAASGCGPVCAAKKAAQAVEQAQVQAVEVQPAMMWLALLGKLAEASRRAMGNIDLDPCSTQEQQEKVKATYWCYPHHGLTRPWGGNVFVVPRDGYALWAEKALFPIGENGADQVVMVMPLETERSWFQNAISTRTDVAVCFLAKEQRMVIYAGPRIAEFSHAFAGLGKVMRSVL